MDKLKLEAETTAKALDILSDQMSNNPEGYRTDIHGIEARCLSRAAELLRATPSVQEAAKVLLKPANIGALLRSAEHMDAVRKGGLGYIPQLHAALRALAQEGE